MAFALVMRMKINILKRQKNIKKIIFVGLLLLSVVIFPITAQAKDTTSKVRISITLDPGEVLSKGDYYKITYVVSGHKKEATITIDVSQFQNEEAELKLPVNTYQVTKFEYIGRNATTRNLDAAVTKDFISVKEDVNYINIAIGTTSTSDLEQNYYDIVRATVKEDATIEQEPTSAVNTKPITTKAQQNVSTDINGGAIRNLALVALFTIAGIVILLILHKKGKI